MFNKILDSIKNIFTGNKHPDKALVTPNWEKAGYLAAQALKNIPADEIGLRRELEDAFEKLYQEHCRACRKVKLPAAMRDVVFDRFKAGWNKQLKG